MFRHWVNFGLLFSFLTLMGSGLFAYLKPFSIVTTRVHLVFGLLTIILVLMHVLARTKYFATKTKGPAASRGMIATIAIAWGGLLVLALWGAWPVEPLVESSYESRHKRQIVRQSSLAGIAKIDQANQLVARLPADGADTSVSLLMRFRDEGAPPPAMAIWAETTTGSLIETLYLDQELAFSETVKWQGVETQRNQLLPIWRNRYTLASGVDPQGEIDAFTAATPSHAFTLDQYLKAGTETRFVLCVEVNAVGDTNAAYDDPKIGQPSLLYTAYIDLDEVPGYRLLELTAHGGGAEKSGARQYDLEKIDTAKDLVDLLLAHVSRMDP